MNMMGSVATLARFYRDAISILGPVAFNQLAQTTCDARMQYKVGLFYRRAMR
jgi:hypothetical protein